MKIVKLIFSAVIITYSTHSWAYSESSAAVTNLIATVIDLDPNDGIDPSIPFNAANSYNSSVGTSLYEFHPSASNWSTESFLQGTSKFAPIESSSASSLGVASASVFGDGTLSGTVLQAFGSSTSNANTNVSYYAGAGILRDTSNAYSAEAFSLSAHTRVIFSADVNLFAGFIPYEQGAYNMAIAYAQLVVFEQGINYNTGPQFSNVEVRAEENSDGFNPSSGSRVQDTITAQFENVNANWLTGAVGISANVHGESRTASVVPVPASVVSFAFGLAVTAWRSRSWRA